MSEMTLRHQFAVRDAIVEMRRLHRNERPKWWQFWRFDEDLAAWDEHYSATEARLSEVAAMIEAKLESRDEG